MFGKITRYVYKFKIYKKRKAWKKQGRIFVDSSAMVFPETQLLASYGSIHIHEKSCVRGTLEIQRENGTIEVGHNCYIGEHSRLWAAQHIEIGNNVLIAHNVNIFDNDTHPKDYLERRIDAENIIWKGVRKNFPSLAAAPVQIEDDVWIGCNSIILKGVHIGTRSIVASGSIVTKDVPPDVMMAGNPARIVKSLQKE